MGKAHHPGRGSMQYWPRKRSKHSFVRINSWAKENEPLPLGIIGYKVGMTHVLAEEMRSKAPNKGEKIHQAVTIIECPPVKLTGANLYQITDRGLIKVGQIGLKGKKIDDYKEFDKVRVLITSEPYKIKGINSKKNKVTEIELGGKLEDHIKYIKENLGKEIKVSDLFKEGEQVDVHGITKGKGTQGVIKRYGVPLRPKKSEKKKRGIGNLGAWTPKRVLFNVPQAGKMGYHLRTEYNKSILKIDNDVEKINPKSGFNKYGLVSNDYLIIKGSIIGSRKRALMVTKPIRKNKKIIAPKVVQIRK